MRSLPAVARGVSSNPEAYVYLAESIRAWPDQAGLAARIAEAGPVGPGRLAQPDRRHRRAAPRHPGVKTVDSRSTRPARMCLFCSGNDDLRAS